MRTDYHVHMAETGNLEVDYLKTYIEKAKEEGIQELGISEHAYFFQETRPILSNPWVENRRTLDFSTYQNMFDQAEKEGLTIKMGIEMDYMPGKEKEMEAFISERPFDYVIGSVHWIDEWGIDLATFRDEYEKRDLYEVYRQYFDRVVTLAESGLFDFVGHIDVIKVFGYRPDDQEFLREQYKRAAEALASTGTCIEISTAGLRKPVGEMYPDPELLQICKDAGVGIVLCSDAHKPDHVGHRYEEAVELAKSAGYEQVHVFTNREASVHPLK
ncbi:histidinol phosphatase [Halobacillus halophilus]|uniref:Histidinol-phosphatase n=1 Tax=Halobacillus halophilus (strain ATCC 35676 / DSM 2266 / JCM 20832 / KCTC 3685 / LMG 17431 / NBRC 102448 / NCIMB 2269) TaxID=866895 RepID=I0JTJ6_HALH3|nr:histidinol-phosphatase [Halobacillus halophilus]ASF41375.1 histidinol phosphatase [Halobacillus halophilus]CCG47469.1 histidinol-phosphatase [Halobacillus halophilus DSM 2266]